MSLSEACNKDETSLRDSFDFDDCTLCHCASPRGQNINDLELTPIEQLWEMGDRGELLTLKGWTRASGLFAQPAEVPHSRIILIRSNYYGAIHGSVEGTHAEVNMGFTDSGQIDSMLRYLPPKPTKLYAAAIRYHLVAVPDVWSLTDEMERN